MGSGWQSGISLWVGFAAMMPAMRAAPSTSPFLALPSSTRSSVFTVITTRPSAKSSRSVAGLADTSTMRASPPLLRWVKFFFLFLAGAIGLSGGARTARRVPNQCTRRLFHVILAHQTLADQERPDANARQSRQIVRCRNSALADDDPIERHPGRKPFAGHERGVEGLEVAVVDADQARSQLERTRQLLGVMDLEQHVHAEQESGVLESLGRLVVDSRHD